MRIIIKKTISSILCLMVITLVNFALPRLMPGDPVLMLTGQNEEAISKAQYEIFRQKLGIEDPIAVQFKRYGENLLHGNLGYSYHYNDTITNLMARRIPNTLQLALPAIVISSLLAVLIGCTTGYQKNRKLDTGMTTGLIIINAIPTFLLAMILVTFFAFRWKLFSLGGLNSIIVPSNRLGALLDRINHLVLPVLTITLSSFPAKYLMVRNTVSGAKDDKYVMYARARGLSENRVKFIHIFKNICHPFITLVGLNLGFIISGSMITEIIFSINGMGGLMYEAATFRDFPTLQGCLFVTAVIVIFFNIITDLICVTVDPRQRYGAYDSE